MGVPLFLFYYLDRMYEKLRDFSHGNNQGALSCRLIENFQVPFPSPQTRKDIGQLSHEIEMILVNIFGHKTKLLAMTQEVARALFRARS